MRKISFTDEQLKIAIASSTSWRQVLHKLGYVNDAGGNHETVKKFAKNLGIDVTHFKGMGWNKNGVSKTALTYDEVFQYGKILKGETLKNNLLKYKKMEYRCAECGNNGVWRDKEIKLEVDHIDGDNKNNTIENLRFLCPNCHSQTPTFRGRGRQWTKPYCCKECNKKINKKFNKSGICIECQKKAKCACGGMADPIV
jgi:Zn finger protein HypA/HybF involved in hydrogenase expression